MKKSPFIQIINKALIHEFRYGHTKLPSSFKMCEDLHWKIVKNDAHFSQILKSLEDDY